MPHASHVHPFSLDSLISGLNMNLLILVVCVDLQVFVFPRGAKHSAGVRQLAGTELLLATFLYEVR